MKYLFLIYIIVSVPFNFTVAGNAEEANSIKRDYTRQVDSVLNLMTLEEKIGQMHQITNDKKYTGPIVKDTGKIEQIRAGRVGSVLNVTTIERCREYQDAAMQSRLKIPLLFGLDVIHGMKTIFPIPLAESGSFDLELIEKTAQFAAFEASAHGIHWTFAPMIDITRDARWGRVMEGAGEDTWYGTMVGKARIKGFQGEGLGANTSVLACAKHFAAYGAGVAGKDYNSVEISENTLRQVYLPPFKAAVEVGVATFMNSFNDINGMPATASSYLQREILKGKWNFEGFVVSDWNSIGELIKHRVAADGKEAAAMAVLGGSDMDMVSQCYSKYLKILVEDGSVKEKLIDEAVSRILMKKFELGLFENPYKYCRRKSDTKLRNRELAKEAGCKSIVLLKNENKTLPVRNGVKSVALVGPLMKTQKDMLGGWAAEGESGEVVTIYEGMKKAFPETKITYIEGYDLETNEIKPLPDLQKYEIIVVAVGERANESGEAKSKADINVNLFQQELVWQLKTAGKPLVVLIMGGRPLIFDKLEPHADAILFTWWLGTEAGNSIGDVLSGKYNPSAKLTMTFPRHVGQCPIYYNFKSTGRPWHGETRYTTGYIDMTNHPAYPFGYGLSYTTFEISSPVMNKATYHFDEDVVISTIVENTGEYAGKETVQLYFQDVVSSLTRPVKEFCGFQQVELAPGEKRNITFKLSADDFGFFNEKNKFITEPGEFKIYVGSNSMDLKETSFTLTK